MSLRSPRDQNDVLLISWNEDWHDIMLTSALCHVMTGIVLIKESEWKTFLYWYHWHLFNFCRWSECFSPSLWSSCCVGDQNSSWPSSSAMNSQHFIQRTHLLLMWVKLEINSLFDCCKFSKMIFYFFFSWVPSGLSMTYYELCISPWTIYVWVWLYWNKMYRWNKCSKQCQRYWWAL